MKTKTPLPLKPTDIDQCEHVEAIDYLIGEIRVHLSYLSRAEKTDKYDGIIAKLDECFSAIIKCGDVNKGKIRLDVTDTHYCPVISPVVVTGYDHA